VKLRQDLDAIDADGNDITTDLKGTNEQEQEDFVLVSRWMNELFL
jgi:hypothetical protein